MGRASRSPVVADATRSWGVGGEVFLGAVVRVNVDLHERILHHRLLHALVKALVYAKFEQQLQQLEVVALFTSWTSCSAGAPRG